MEERVRVYDMWVDEGAINMQCAVDVEGVVHQMWLDVDVDVDVDVE